MAINREKRTFETNDMMLGRIGSLQVIGNILNWSELEYFRLRFPANPAPVTFTCPRMCGALRYAD